ncbi:SPFH domain-containing protein [Paenibacillus sabuli]|uniref:SPFH domain-containing protein n=1 Tax=Paenibacillus sabuli TaxID=2772509 RepID=UPI00295AEC8B|nr:SPFH domain-containing protein [Paenibacillus sabuli]
MVKFYCIAKRNWLVYRYPGDSFVIGTQLIVGEGQIAVFFKGGKAMDFLGAGTYTLHTGNIPILQSIINLPFGNTTPFKAELFFINRTVKLDLLWGTSDPISLIDPKYKVRLRVRAFGQFGMRISDYRVFLTELIGALGDREVVKYDMVLDYYRGVTVTKIKTLIADTIINKKISVLEIAPMLEELSKAAEASVSDEFSRFGIEIVNFYLSSINFPDEDFDKINKLLGERAAFDISGDHRYSVKRSFDVMETAAGNESDGGLASAGLGLGIGGPVGQAFAQSTERVFTTQPRQETVECGSCGHANKAGNKFCGNCGGKLAPARAQCGACGSEVDGRAKFCPECGNSMQKLQCPGCGHEHEPGTKFCSECGTRVGGEA